MKRQIKFRGKRVDNGEWVYGGIQIQHPHLQDHYIIDSDGYRQRVIPETVGQFTGLFDKDGKDVWEGDLVSFSGSKDIPPLKVVFRNGAFGLYHSTDFLKDIYGNGAFLGYLHRLEEIKFTVEIISRIHDTPELIK